MRLRTLTAVSLALVVVLGLAVVWLTGAGSKQLTSRPTAAHDEAAAEVLGDEELAARACDTLAQAQPDDWWAAHDAVLPLVGESFRVAVLLGSLPCPELVPPAR